jgi:hypothetical protein
VFGELPNGLAAVGILITVIAGLAVIYFEHRANRAPPLPAPPQDASPPDASSSGN